VILEDMELQAHVFCYVTVQRRMWDHVTEPNPGSPLEKSDVAGAATILRVCSTTWSHRAILPQGQVQLV
jgi:hypothetical protein